MLKTNLGSFESSVAVHAAPPLDPNRPLHFTLDANIAGLVLSTALEPLLLSERSSIAS